MTPEEIQNASEVGILEVYFSQQWQLAKFCSASVTLARVEIQTTKIITVGLKQFRIKPVDMKLEKIQKASQDGMLEVKISSEWVPALFVSLGRIRESVEVLVNWPKAEGAEGARESTTILRHINSCRLKLESRNWG